MGIFIQYMNYLHTRTVTFHLNNWNCKAMPKILSSAVVGLTVYSKGSDTPARMSSFQLWNGCLQNMVIFLLSIEVYRRANPERAPAFGYVLSFWKEKKKKTTTKKNLQFYLFMYLFLYQYRDDIPKASPICIGIYFLYIFSCILLCLLSS